MEASCTKDAPIHIWAVEDDRLTREILGHRLAGEGYQFQGWPDAETMLAELEHTRPELLLLDLNLPGMSGLEALRLIRRRHTPERLPVIIATVKDASQDVVAGLEAGANDYVTKPFQFPVLLARLRVHLLVRRCVAELVMAEQHRVMIESMTAVCHHLGQPLTGLLAHLQLLLEDEPTGHTRQVLEKMLGWAQQVGDMLHQMQKLTTYRTIPYLHGQQMIDIQAAPDQSG